MPDVKGFPENVDRSKSYFSPGALALGFSYRFANAAEFNGMRPTLRTASLAVQKQRTKHVTDILKFMMNFKNKKTVRGLRQKTATF